MDIFFADPNDVPLPPDEVKIRKLEARPYPEGQRIAIRFEVTPFQERPNIDINIKNEQGHTVSNLSVVEVMDNRMEFTMHLKEERPVGKYTISMRVFYADIESFEPDEKTPTTVEDVLTKTGQTIDTKQINFELVRDE